MHPWSVTSLLLWLLGCQTTQTRLDLSPHTRTHTQTSFPLLAPHKASQDIGPKSRGMQISVYRCFVPVVVLAGDMLVVFLCIINTETSRL